MANNSKSSGSGSGKGIGFAGALQIAFIILKLLGKIRWSWLWVLSPTWMPLAVVSIIGVIIAFVKIRGGKR
jgi:hypothetical protein